MSHTPTQPTTGGLVHRRGLGQDRVKRSVGPVKHSVGSVERPRATAHAAHEETGAGEAQGEAQARVEEGDEPLGEETSRAHPNAHGHHDRHHDVAPAVEEAEGIVALTFQLVDALGILFDEFAEHRVEPTERSNRSPSKIGIAHV